MLLRELVLTKSLNTPEEELWLEADEARLWRCIRVGSTLGTFAMRAKRERTRKVLRVMADIQERKRGR